MMRSLGVHCNYRHAGISCGDPRLRRAAFFVLHRVAIPHHDQHIGQTQHPFATGAIEIAVIAAGSHPIELQAIQTA